MSTISTRSFNDVLLRSGLKYFNRFMVLLWRLGLGGWVNGWPAVGGPILVLTHQGRRSKQPRQTPLNYAEVDGELYCVAGFGHVSDWYRNVLINPVVETWLPTGRWQGIAEDITDSAESLNLVRAVLRNSGFATYTAGINPFRMSDETLREATKNYKLVHIQRLNGYTSAQEPADLAWLWPLSTVILLVYVLGILKQGTSHDEPS